MRMRLVKEGDTVDFMFGQAESFYNVVVLSAPADTGDLWYFEDKDGNTYGLNPHCEDFHYVVKARKDEETNNDPET